MSETPLQIAMRNASTLRLRVLEQQILLANIRREGGEKYEQAQEVLNALRDELDKQQSELDKLEAHAVISPSSAPNRARVAPGKKQSQNGVLRSFPQNSQAETQSER
jgi:hypothetical protein